MSGKAVNKATLQKMMGLNEEPHVPIVAMVSRLVSHKGLDLVREVLHDIMELPLQLVVLGKGDAQYEEFFRWAAQQYSGRMSVCLDYNESLSMAIYSGADLFLMPSKSEPCGLSQMIAMRYGTVPIVRETGGLRDSVRPYEAWRDAGTGFTFANYSSSDMLHVINEAVYLYKDYPDAFGRLRGRAMAEDFSWGRSAKEYLRIYANITGQMWENPVMEEVPAVEEAPAEEITAPVEKKETPKAKKAPAKKASAKKTEKTTEKKATKKATKAESAAEIAADPAEKPAEIKTRKKGTARTAAKEK